MLWLSLRSQITNIISCIANVDISIMVARWYLEYSNEIVDEGKQLKLRPKWCVLTDSLMCIFYPLK